MVNKPAESVASPAALAKADASHSVRSRQHDLQHIQDPAQRRLQARRRSRRQRPRPEGKSAVDLAEMIDKGSVDKLVEQYKKSDKEDLSNFPIPGLS